MDQRWVSTGGGIGGALALAAVLFFGVFCVAGAASARAGCLEPALDLNFGNQPVGSITERADKIITLCEAEIVEVNPKEDSAELHPSLFQNCNLVAGKVFQAFEECSIPFVFEPTEPRAFSSKYFFKWKNLETGVQESDQIELSGVGRRAFQASGYPATVSGGQTTKHVFTVQGNKVECGTASFTTELSAASETIEVTPSYSECSAFGFVGASIAMNGCKYKFSISSGSADKYEGGVQIVCSGSNEIVVTAATCTVRIPAQTPATPTVAYENKTGPPSKVLAIPNVKGIRSKVTSGFLCPLTAKEKDETGTYTGATEFAASGSTSFKID